MGLTLDQQVFTFQPSDYTANGQKTLFTVRDSYLLIVAAAIRVETAFSGGTPSITVGTTGTTDLLAAAADITEGTPGVYLGSGTNKLLAPGTDVIVNYTGHGSTTQGLARVAITAIRVGV